MNKEKETLQAMLRLDFQSFVEKVFSELSGNEFLPNWHIGVICDALMDMHENKNHRLIVNIPPRYLKSIICSVAYPAWLLGRNPRLHVICVSYSDELGQKLALDCKRVMETNWYKELFPQTRIAKDKRAITDYKMTRGGGRYTTSVEGTLTGIGGDYIIIDDPIKPKDSHSDLQRKKVNDWFGHTLISRLNDKNRGKILLIMQRLHEDDLTGYLLDNSKEWQHIRIPAIAEDHEVWTLRSGKIIKREIGDVLHPERENLAKLEEMKKSMGLMNFSGQYQQNPMVVEGSLVKKSWFHYYDGKDFKLPEKYSLLQSWDTASKSEDINDYSVCITAIRFNRKLYIVDVLRERLDFPDLLRKVKSHAKRMSSIYKKNSMCVIIEDRSSGIQLAQSLGQKKFGPNDFDLFPISPKDDKKTRLLRVSPLIENGTVLFPNNNPDWWRIFERELLTFPNSKYKDQVDAFSQLLENWTLRTSAEKMFALHKAYKSFSENLERSGPFRRRSGIWYT